MKAFQWCLSQQMTAVSRTVTVLEIQCGGGGQEEEKKEVRGDREQSLGSEERQVQSRVSSAPLDHSLSKPQHTMPYGQPLPRRSKSGPSYSLFHYFHFIYWLCRVFVAAWAFSSCSERGLLFGYGARASHHSGFSGCRGWALGAWASVVLAHGLSCSTACGILPDQGSNPCLLHWQVDSSPLDPQGNSWSLTLL